MKARVRQAWLWTFLIFVLCWMPKVFIPGRESWTPSFLSINIDKLVHFGIFSIFAFLWLRATQKRNRTLWVFLWGIALAIITELGQENKFVNRDANVPDALADILGATLGILAYWAHQKRLERQSRGETLGA